MRRHFDSLFAFGCVLVVLLLVIPIPPLLLDVLLSFSLVLGVMTLLLTLYIKTSDEFNSFPSLLLFLTLFRLGLNIASARMILTDGEAGQIIATFGSFVGAGNLGVGLIIFGLVTIVNFIVITKGSGRVAEVAARFTLEALPGKQLAIDGELTSGLITQAAAKEARAQISREAEFYGAMDGASKFVRGDAIAQIAIVLVNLFGGFAIGMISKGMNFSEALSIYTQLTIGDGLVSQIPALLVSVGSGIIVTRASNESLGKTIPKQLFCHPKVLNLSGILLLVLGLVPGMPLMIMALVAAGLFFLGKKFTKDEREASPVVERVEKKVEEALFVPPIAVELGGALLSYATPLFEKTSEIRQVLAEKLGILIPSVHVVDNLNLPDATYHIKIKGVSVANGHKDHFDVILRHLIKTLEEHSALLLTRQDVAKMCETAKIYDSAVVEELIPRKLTLGQMLKVFQNLLREKVSIRDTVTILEVLADNLLPGETVDTDFLTEQVRLSLSRGIVEHIKGEGHQLYAITLDPKVEQMISASVTKVGNASLPHLRPQTIEKIAGQIEGFLKEKQFKAVLLTSAASRRPLHHLLQKHLPDLSILSYQEISADVQIESAGSITTDVLI